MEKLLTFINFPFINNAFKFGIFEVRTKIEGIKKESANAMAFEG
jgi:hypothetical protein